MEDLRNKIMARQESVNKRMKQFGCLSQIFRHDLAKHGDVVRAVAVITQLSMVNEKPLFEVVD